MKQTNVEGEKLIYSKKSDSLSFFFVGELNFFNLPRSIVINLLVTLKLLHFSFLYMHAFICDGNWLFLKDLELAKIVGRPGSPYQQDLSKARNFSDEGYGSVTRVFIVCDEDKAMTLEHQRWMIENNPPKDVWEIKGSDHMPMFSMTKQLCVSLLEIANKYA